MDSYPALFPPRLEPVIDTEILKVRSKTENVTERIIQASFCCAEIGCKAAEDGEWRVDLANSGIDDFIGHVCHDERWNGNTGNRLFLSEAEERRLKVAIINSAEWLKFKERLANVAQGIGRREAEANSNNQPHGKEQTRKEIIMPILERLGMTPSQWADRAGVDPSVVYDYLKGKSNPRPVSRKSLAEAIKLKIEDFPP